MSAGAAFSAARIGALMIKEFIQLRRDRLTFAMILIVPVLQLVLFGYAINTDPKRTAGTRHRLGRQWSGMIRAVVDRARHLRAISRSDRG